MQQLRSLTNYKYEQLSRSRVRHSLHNGSVAYTNLFTALSLRDGSNLITFYV